MAIRTMIRNLLEKLGAPSLVRPWRFGLAFGATMLLISATAAADYAAGLSAFNRKDYPRAFSEWIESAKAGDAHAQHGVGMLYELGQGVPDADPKAAADWYRKAAAQSYAPALNNLARLYADGRGVKQDVPKAIELWSTAAAGGNVTARFNLGLQYASGSGVPKDLKKAADYMLLAAESGLPEAQFAVAGFYRDGAGIEKDLEAAQLWYERAAKAGFEPARAELAALTKPAPSPGPPVADAAAAPAAADQAQAEMTGTPPQPQGTSGERTGEPAEGQPQESAPAAPQQAAATPPAPQSEQADVPASSEAPDAASTEQPPAEAAGPPPVEEEPTQEPAPESPGGEDSAAPDAQDPGLPVADSLTGDAQVYRIWVYTSGQEGDARSHWDKLTVQYPRLLKELQLDLRRYFLGEAKGSLYRVFAGPFEDLGAAQKACEDIKQRSGDQFCRPVLN